MFNILMVCTGNICRSPMAAGLLAHNLPPDLTERAVVTSAGTHGLHGRQAEPHAIQAMAELGIDIRGHRARQIDAHIVRSADLILTMEAAHSHGVKRLIKWRQTPPRMISEFSPQTAVHDIEDPYGDSLEAYRQCIRTLRPCVKGVILWLGSNL